MLIISPHHRAIPGQDKAVSDNPFKPNSSYKTSGPGRPGRTFGGELKYIEEGPTKREPHEVLERPFRPPHPSKTGQGGALNKFPQYMEDPIPAKLQAGCRIEGLVLWPLNC